MSDPHNLRPTSNQSDDSWESLVQSIASRLEYPPTPDIVGRMREQKPPRPSRPLVRRLALATLAIVLIVGGLLAVPQARAALVEILRVGAVTIHLVEPTDTLTPTGSPAATLTPPVPLASVADLAGETTLSDAQSRVRFPIRLPTYPADLGLPDRVFLQNLGGRAVILVWLQPGTQTQAQLSLHVLGPGVEATKGPPDSIAFTMVHDQPAVWATGPYYLLYGDGSAYMSNQRRLVSGHVLIWEEGGLTYRLETDLSMEEAVAIAESLEEWGP